MKIAFFTDSYFPHLNGVTISVANYAKELRKKGHTVYIFAPKIKNYKDREKDVYRLPSLKILSSEPEVLVPVGVSYKGFFKLIRMDFDVIHAHGNGAFSLLGYEVARAEGIPYVLTFHTLHDEYTHYFFDGKIIRPGVVKRAFTFIANRCDGVIAPSEKMKQKLKEFGFARHVTVIPNFVETALFANPKKGYLHKKLHLHKDTPIILSVGRLGKEKNFDFVLRTFAKLAAKESSSHLVIVGQGMEKKNLEMLAQALDITSRVHFTGKIAAALMPRVYADANIFVFASTTETQGVCVLEAAVSGVPMVVVDDLAFSDIAIRGKNALTVPLNEVIFAKNVLKLLQDKKMQAAFHSYATHIAEKHDAKKLSDAMVTLYASLAAKRRFQLHILKRVNHAATRGVRGIRKTKRFTSQALSKVLAAGLSQINS